MIFHVREMRLILDVNIKIAEDMLQFKVDKSIMLGIVFQDKSKKDRFIMSMTGKESVIGDIILQGISIQNDRITYKKHIDLIKGNMLDSTLIVEEFILFYCMTSGIYNKDTKQKFDEVLEKLGLQTIKGISMEQLTKEQQIFVRCIAAYLKDVKLLICDDIMNGLNEEDKADMSVLLESNFVEHGCLCILTSEDRKSIERYSDQIIFI